MKLADFKRLPEGTMLHRVRTLMGPCNTFVTVVRAQSNALVFAVPHKREESFLQFPKAAEFRAEGGSILILKGAEVAVEYRIVTAERRARTLFWSEWVDSVVGDLAHDAWRRLMKEPHLKLYLFHKPGFLVAEETCPKGFVPGPAEPLPGIELPHLYTWMRDRTGRLPIIPANR